ncbi:MAG: serine/threonine protein kinase [Candidatus Brocadiae bacterium]|nr:serine/threonine protein kinase [Candidatus Brocadiia bacterium]
MSSEKIPFTCIHCGNTIQVFPSDVDRIMKCDRCARFCKIPGQVQKRLEILCKHCQTALNLPLKTRGKMYRCWNCQLETEVFGPANIIVKAISAPQEVEQGLNNYVVSMKLFNPGTIAQVQSFQFDFYNNKQDVRSCYEVNALSSFPNSLQSNGEIDLQFNINVAQNAVPGMTQVYIRIFGQDELDGREIQAQVEVRWVVLYQRIFDIQTEHNLQETAGVPFALQLYAYLPNGNLDKSYHGSHIIYFESTTSQYSPEATIFKNISVEFYEGIGITKKEFVLYNSLDSPQIQAVENVLGGPKGVSEPITILAGQLDGFEVLLTSQQINDNIFQGKNEIRAIDKYGNLVKTFDEDVWIHTLSNQGDINIGGMPSNTIPGKAFNRGIADLSALNFSYGADEENNFPISEVFIISYQNKEQRSAPISINENPIKIRIKKMIAPEKEEQGKSFSLIVVLNNMTYNDLQINLSKIQFRIACKGISVDKYYRITYEQSDILLLPANSELSIPFGISIMQDAPIGNTQLQFNISGVELIKGLIGKAKGVYSWEVVPSGRVFRILSPLTVQAGKTFNIRLGAYLRDECDKTYSGNHTLFFDVQASPSPNDTDPQIPEHIEANFIDGVTELSSCVAFTNTTEKPKLRIYDPEAGGPAMDAVEFHVYPAELEFFWLSLQDEIINTFVFEKNNHVMAMDAYGNLIVDFHKPCTISCSSKKGELRIQGKEDCTIPANSFHDGIADLEELQIAYHSSTRSNLPYEEDFSVHCGKKKGKSKTVNILPRPAQISIVRCSYPEDIEQGGENYPIYLEMENMGDCPAEISSVLFSFRQQGDVSSHYTTLPAPTNLNSLVAGIPLQLVYHCKVSQKVPTGITYVEAKVTGLDTRSSLPLQAQTKFQWKVESKGRSFYAETEHQNQEVAGMPFALRIFTYLENQKKDPGFSGDYALSFSTNATSSPGGNAPEFPQEISLHFEYGEALTPKVFHLFNAKETPVFKMRSLSNNIQGTSSSIKVLQGASHALYPELVPSVTNRKPLQGSNTVKALDAFGNLKMDFHEDIQVSLKNFPGCLLDGKANSIVSFSGGLFKNGILDLTAQNFSICADPDHKLPCPCILAFSFKGKEFLSKEISVLPSPVDMSVEEIECSQKIIQTHAYPVKIFLHNHGSESVEIGSVKIEPFREGKTYQDFQFEPDNSNKFKVQPGPNALLYWLTFEQSIAPGKISAKIQIFVKSPSEHKLEGIFHTFLEPSGRVLTVESENHNLETAGIPFSLRLTTLLNDQIDTSYEGQYKLVFSHNAKPAPNGKSPVFPEILIVSFSKGQAVTSREFILYRAGDVVEISIHEQLEGGARGISQPIMIKPAELNSFKFSLSDPQINATCFANQNTLLALDIYTNQKTDFGEDVRIYSESKKADVYILGAEVSNILPGKFFKEGIVDLSSLEFRCTYPPSLSEQLPISERFVASYNEKESLSNPVIIKPRPAQIVIEEILFPETLYQGIAGVTFKAKVSNIGDSKINIKNISFAFHNGKDITNQFTTSAYPQNRSILAPGSTTHLDFYINILKNADIGNVNLALSLLAFDTQKEMEVVHKISFKVMESLREFKIKTQHENIETAGKLFTLKITVLKDGEQDKHYKGTHEVFFSTTAGAAGNTVPSCPNSLNILFTDGYAETAAVFMLSKASEKPIIKAEEPQKAIGETAKIDILTGKLQCLKILFNKEKDTHYQLQPLDQYDNIIPHQYTLDDDIHPGAILSGSEGSFYEVQEIVGHGAMGKVYRGKRLNDNLDVAIKTTLFNALSDINRFLMEGMMLIRFNHPNIVKGYDLRQICTVDKGRFQSKFFMVMEYLPGQSVKDILDSAKSGVLSCSWATKIILHSARALAYMWDHQTIHRDIKPENIQITDEQRIKLIDLGIARAESGEVDIFVTQKDTIVGSYPYISPERLKSTNIDFRADMYSLGATYYHLLTGMPPYLDTYKGTGGKDLLDYLIRVRTKRTPTPVNKLVNIPGSVSDVVMTMLNLKPEKRFSSAAQLLQALESVFQEVG